MTMAVGTSCSMKFSLHSRIAEKGVKFLVLVIDDVQKSLGGHESFLTDAVTKRGCIHMHAHGFSWGCQEPSY